MEIDNLGFGFLINLLARIILSSQNKQLSSLGVSAHHGRLILYLYDNKDHEINQIDIKKDMFIKDSTVSVTIDNMEKNGLIERNILGTDKRYRKIELTQLGMSLYFRLKEEIELVEHNLVKGMTEEEKELFRTLIIKAINNFEIY